MKTIINMKFIEKASIKMPCIHFIAYDKRQNNIKTLEKEGSYLGKELNKVESRFLLASILWVFKIAFFIY